MNENQIPGDKVASGVVLTPDGKVDPVQIAIAKLKAEAANKVPDATAPNESKIYTPSDLDGVWRRSNYFEKEFQKAESRASQWKVWANILLVTLIAFVVWIFWADADRITMDAFASCIERLLGVVVGFVICGAAVLVVARLSEACTPYRDESGRIRWLRVIGALLLYAAVIYFIWLSCDR